MDAEQRSAQATHPLAGSPDLAKVLDSVEDEIVVVDTAYRLLFANSAASGSLRAATPSPEGDLCYQVVEHTDSPCSTPVWMCPLQQMIQTGDPISITHPCPEEQGALSSAKYIKLSMYPLKDPDGRITGAVCLRRDVSAERKLEAEMLTRHHQLLALSRISEAVSGLSRLDDILNVALDTVLELSLIHISEPTRRYAISYAVFCFYWILSATRWAWRLGKRGCMSSCAMPLTGTRVCFSTPSQPRRQNASASHVNCTTEPARC